MAQSRVLNILSALAGRKPVYNIAADVLNVTYEWLAFPGKTLLHWLHTCLTLRNDPMMWCFIETKALPQATQVENSNIRTNSNIRKVICFSHGICASSSDVVVSWKMVDLATSAILSSVIWVACSVSFLGVDVIWVSKKSQ